MEAPIKVEMGDETVRFTPDGMVFVQDAIDLFCPEEKSRSIWEKIKKDHPGILIYCEDYNTPEGESILIVNSEGWDRIIDILPEYLFND